MFALIVDSGSTVTYVPCSDCEQCGKHQVILTYSKDQILCLVSCKVQSFKLSYGY